MSKKHWIAEKRQLTEKRWLTQKRRMIKILLALGGLIVMALPAGACLGARPLAMGGAFVAVSDDAHACYWNPAGLALLSQQERPYHFTTMYTINNRDYINYQEWFAYTQPYLDFLGLGISYVHEKIDYSVELTPPVLHRDSGWLTSSVGFSFSPRWAMGWNIREYLNEWRWKNQSVLSSVLSLDLGVLYQLSPKVRLGILIQDINQPVETFSFPGVEFILRYGMNIRPGIAYFPDPTTIIALDIYYFTLANVGEDWQSEVRLGIEKWVTDNLALRAGFYGWDFQTVGAGYRWEIAGFQLQIDYALLASNPVYAPAGTHMLSVGAKF